MDVQVYVNTLTGEVKMVALGIYNVEVAKYPWDLKGQFILVRPAKGAV